MLVRLHSSTLVLQGHSLELKSCLFLTKAFYCELSRHKSSYVGKGKESKELFLNKTVVSLEL